MMPGHTHEDVDAIFRYTFEYWKKKGEVLNPYAFKEMLGWSVPGSGFCRTQFFHTMCIRSLRYIKCFLTALPRPVVNTWSHNAFGYYMVTECFWRVTCTTSFEYVHDFKAFFKDCIYTTVHGIDSARFFLIKEREDGGALSFQPRTVLKCSAVSAE
eukprot:6202682-Pleurochrysis_carterae.AAC.2